MVARCAAYTVTWRGMIPLSRRGAAISDSRSFRTATAEITLSFSFCSISSKSVVTSSAENGSAFSIWIRTISGNSAGSTVGSRKRCARTAETGKLKTRSSCTETSDAASSKLWSKRTFHEPLASRARSRFQPCAVGVMKTWEDGVSMTKTPSR